MKLLPKPIYSFASFLSIASGLLILFVAGLTVADVVQRSIFDRSILGTVEITTLMLVAIAFLGLASAEIDNRHVSVDLLERHLSPSVRRALNIVRIILLVVIGFVLIWGLSNNFWSSLERSETTNGILRLFTWPAKLVLTLSFFLYFIVAIWKSFNELIDSRSNVGGDLEKDVDYEFGRES